MVAPAPIMTSAVPLRTLPPAGSSAMRAGHQDDRERRATAADPQPEQKARGDARTRHGGGAFLDQRLPPAMLREVIMRVVRVVLVMSVAGFASRARRTGFFGAARRAGLPNCVVMARAQRLRVLVKGVLTMRRERRRHDGIRGHDGHETANQPWAQSGSHGGRDIQSVVRSRNEIGASRPNRE